MGVIIILTLLFVGFIFLARIGDCDWKDLLGSIGAVCIGIALLIIIGGCIGENACEEKVYYDLLEEKTAIEYRLDQMQGNFNLNVNGGVYNDMVEFNNQLRSYKLYTDNFWIGWFYAEKPAELDYIELIKDTP